MRDVTLIQEFQRLNQVIEMLSNSIRLVSSSELLFDETIKTLLLKKGIITETEFKDTLGEIINKINAKQAEAEPEKKAEELVTPTQAEVAKVEESKQ